MKNEVTADGLSKLGIPAKAVLEESGVHLYSIACQRVAVHSNTHDRSLPERRSSVDPSPAVRRSEGTEPYYTMYA